MITQYRQRQLFRQLIGEIISWLENSEQPVNISTVKDWGTDHWEFIRELVFIQGLGSYLHSELAETKIYSHFPGEFTAWLEKEYANNARRIERLYSDLHKFLIAANKSGVAVMPLKGIILSGTYYPDPAMRPMADIDLLIRPHDRGAAQEIMKKFGYTLIPTTSIYPNHDTYLNPGGEKIINWTGEDPDNPRPFEIHTVIRRTLWGDIGLVDLTEMMWNDSYEGRLFGEKVCLPSRRALILHTAIHAMQHFIIASGRLISWLDLAMLGIENRDLVQVENTNLVYPILRLSQRALPRRFEKLDLNSMVDNVSRRLRRWCERVALDDRCGLINTPKPESRRIQFFIRRWNPKPWRLALGYGDVPYINALIQHGAAMIRHYPHRVR